MKIRIKQYKKWIPVLLGLLLLCGLSGCSGGWKDRVAENAKAFVAEKAGEAVQAALQGLDDGLNAMDSHGSLGKHYFENQQEAENFLLSGLKDRYGIAFTIIETDSYTQYGPIYGDVYIAKAAPKDHPDQTFFVRATQTGELEDTYGECLFGKEAESGLLAVCQKKDYITGFELSISGSGTKRAWTKDDSAREYFAAADGMVRADISVAPGKSQEEYADEIYDFLNDTYSLAYNMTIAFTNGTQHYNYIFFEDIIVNGDNKTVPLTKEKILELIENF